uniref:Small ribosomal subunit protein uS11c n=1 Tax=Pterocladiophila hemisphaerica TaxID=2712948 RepID=A0A6M3WWQ2_9FLOR|nr:ribosomal protein S11 [Pterocladiophila hemisphaerica]
MKSIHRINNALLYIQSTFNNTLITVTDFQGKALYWSSSGVNGFKGSKKNTPFAAQITAEKIALKSLQRGINYVELLINGPGSNRDIVINTLQLKGLNIILIKDVTSLPHNGCRPPKKRRI